MVSKRVTGLGGAMVKPSVFRLVGTGFGSQSSHGRIFNPDTYNLSVAWLQWTIFADRENARVY